MRRIRHHITLGLKGMAMGAADVVPGVSGGTIAFISGIYEELLDSIKSVNAQSLKLLFTFQLADFWKAVNGNFLLAIVVGILLSVVALSKRITYVLEHHPILLWSFFFGLIIASAVFVAGQVYKWNVKTVGALFTGTFIAFVITSVAPAETTTAIWFVFLSGCVAICAMILPGISGSFILLLMGKYQYIMQSISELNYMVVGVFAAGCVTGLLTFSRLLSWMFKKQHDLTVAMLTGFMIGSLNKVWPWKVTTETFVNRHGEVKPLVQQNVLPGDFPSEPNLLWAIVLAILGYVIVMALEKLSNRKGSKM